MQCTAIYVIRDAMHTCCHTQLITVDFSPNGAIDTNKVSEDAVLLSYYSSSKVHQLYRS